MCHLVLLLWQTAGQGILMSPPNIAGVHRPWETCTCEIMCLGCEVFDHVGTGAIAKVACPWWQVVNAPFVSMAQSHGSQQARGLSSSSWQHIPMPSSSVSSTQQCAAVNRGSAPVPGRRQKKTTGSQELGGVCVGKVTTDLSSSSLSFIELPWNKHLLCRTYSSPKITIKVIA